MISKKQKRQPLPLKIIIGAFLGSLAIASAIIFTVLYVTLQTPPDFSYLEGNPQGVRELSRPRQLVNFVLPDEHGDTLQLRDLRGKPVLMYFGYTHCPDVCLITLSDIKQVRELLGDAADDLHYVFISVDGERDTPERLSSYFAQRGVDTWLRGMSGDDVTLAQVSADYGLYYERVKEETDKNGYYPVDHTANNYLVNAKGELVTIFAYGTQPELIVEQIKKHK